MNVAAETVLHLGPKSELCQKPIVIKGTPKTQCLENNFLCSYIVAGQFI